MSSRPLDAKSRIHQMQTMSPAQARRMASGEVEFDPTTFHYKCSSRDRELHAARKQLEDLKERRELEKSTGAWF